jgi:hypothetical protein
VIISKVPWLRAVAIQPFVRQGLILRKNFRGGNLLLLWEKKGLTQPEQLTGAE